MLIKNCDWTSRNDFKRSLNLISQIELEINIQPHKVQQSAGSGGDWELGQSILTSGKHQQYQRVIQHVWQHNGLSSYTYTHQLSISSEREEQSMIKLIKVNLLIRKLMQRNSIKEIFSLTPLVELLHSFRTSKPQFYSHDFLSFTL